MTSGLSVTGILVSFVSPASLFRAPCNGIRIPESEKFWLVESRCWALKSEIRHMESGIPLTIENRKQTSTDNGHFFCPQGGR